MNMTTAAGSFSKVHVIDAIIHLRVMGAVPFTGV